MPDNPVVTAAVIGAGIMGSGHAAVLAQNRQVRLAAVASLPLAAAQEVADRHGATATDDYRKILDDPRIDLVTIATPDHLHAEICAAAASAGKHFLVEKPLTTSLVEADRVVAQVRGAGIKAMTCFNHRWIPSYAQARAEIEAGRIGSPRLAYARKNDRIYVPTQMLSWAGSTTSAWFLSSHDIDLVTWFMGAKATSVHATAVNGVLASRGIDTPDAITAQVRYAGGGVATFESCWIYPDTYPTMTDSFIEVVGTDGVINLERKSEQIEIATADSYQYPRLAIMPTIHGRQRGAMADAINHFVDCVIDDAEPLVAMESSRHVIAILDALHRSLDSGASEPVE
jgi:predicted dehydrogenase